MRARPAGRVLDATTWIVPLASALTLLVLIRAPTAAPAASTVRVDGLTFSVAPGAVLTKRFETSFRLQVQDLETRIEGGAGENVRPSYPQATDVSTHELLRVTDRYHECDARGPLVLQRSFFEWRLADASGEIAGPDGVGAALKGRDVRFARQPDTTWLRELLPLPDGAAEPAVVVSDDEIDLAKLSPDLDFLALLPPGDVEVGASWDVPLESAENLATPGLDLRRVLGLDAPSLLPLLGYPPPDVPPPMLRCTYRGKQQLDGREIATIALTLSLHAPLVPDAASSAALTSSIRGGATIELDRFTHDLVLDATGRLLWDLDAGHFRSFELTLSLDLERAFAAAVHHEGEASKLSARQRFLVELSIAAAVE